MMFTEAHLQRKGLCPKFTPINLDTDQHTVFAAIANSVWNRGTQYSLVFHSLGKGNNEISSGKKCPWNVYPLKPHCYIEKMGYAGVYYFSYFCSKTWIVGTRYNRLAESNIKIFLLKILIFTTKKISIYCMGKSS